MTTFEGGPVKQFDNLKIKTPEQLQAEQKAIDMAEQQRKQAEKSTSDIKNAAALDAVIDGYQADQAIANIPDDPNNPNFGKEGNKFDITNNNEKNLQYLKDNPRAVDDIKAKMEFMKNQLAKKNDKSGEVSQSGEVSNTVPKKAIGFLDGFKTLFDSPLASEFKAIFYNMMALFGKEEDKNKYATEAAFSEAEQKISKLDSGKDEEEKEKVMDNAGNKITYIRALKIITLGKNDENMQALKLRFAGAGIDQQKAYIAAAIKDPTNKDLLNILGEKVDKPSKTKEQEKNPNIIKVKGLDDKNPDSENSVELKGEGDNQYMSTEIGILPLKNGKISLYGPSLDKKNTIQKIVSFEKQQDGNLISKVEDGKKDLPIDNETILKNLNDNMVFDLWKTKKLAVSLSNDDIKNNNVDQAKAHELILKYHKEFDKLGTDQRTKESLQKTLTNLKTELLAITPEDKKKSAWSDLDRIEIGS